MKLSFQATHDLIALALLLVGCYIVWTHPYGEGLPDFSVYAVRSARTRTWHETTPAVPASVQQLEKRLNKDLDVMEVALRKAAGVKPGKRMPWNKTIWQSWKNRELEDWRRTWIQHNPDWKYELVLDDQADTLIRTTYANVPDVLEIWNSLKRPVIKADLFRYLVIFAYGGLYTDVDTTSNKPLDEWLTPRQWKDPAVHAVIALSGVGFAEAFMELVQWTFLARPLSPLIRTGLVTSITNIRRKAAQQEAQALTQVEWDFVSVLGATGPIAFTEFCIKSIRKETRGIIDETFFWGLVYDQTKPVQAGGVVVLPLKGGWRGHGGGAPDEYFSHHNQASWVKTIGEAVDNKKQGDKKQEDDSKS